MKSIQNKWTEEELLIAMNLYCKLPFGKFDQSNGLIRNVAERIGRTPGSLAMKLCNLASLDSYHQERGVVGLQGASKLDREVWQAFQKNWDLMADKSESAFNCLMDETAAEEKESKVPEGPSEVMRTVKTRRLQRFFRDSVLASYEFRCAVSGIGIPELLTASHIIPWCDSEEWRTKPTNGICLNALYDRAFDRGLITFDEKYRMVLSDKLKDGYIPEFQKKNFIKVEGSVLRLPHRFPPDFDALDYHRNEIFQS